MKKIVSYTSEELENIPSETDWERVRMMTEEEIEALDTSDEGLGDDWTKRATVVRLHGRKIPGQNDVKSEN